MAVVVSDTRWCFLSEVAITTTLLHADPVLLWCALGMLWWARAAGRIGRAALWGMALVAGAGAVDTAAESALVGCAGWIGLLCVTILVLVADSRVRHRR